MDLFKTLLKAAIPVGICIITIFIVACGWF